VIGRAFPHDSRIRLWRLRLIILGELFSVKCDVLNLDIRSSRVVIIVTDDLVYKHTYDEWKLCFFHTNCISWFFRVILPDLYSEVKSTNVVRWEVMPSVFEYAVSKFNVCHLDYYTNIANKSNNLQMSVKIVFWSRTFLFARTYIFDIKGKYSCNMLSNIVLYIAK